MKRHSGGGKPVQFQSPQKFRQQQEQNLFIVENFNQEPPRPNIRYFSLFSYGIASNNINTS